MSKRKNDAEIIAGFKVGGATEITIHKKDPNGKPYKKYRRATMVVEGKFLEVQKIPTSSHLDSAALKRKARDYVGKCKTYNTQKLVW